MGALRIPAYGCVPSWAGVWNPPGAVHIPRDGAVVLQARNRTLAPPSGQAMVSLSLKPRYLRHLPKGGVLSKTSYPVQDCRRGKLRPTGISLLPRLGAGCAASENLLYLFPHLQGPLQVEH